MINKTNQKLSWPFPLTAEKIAQYKDLFQTEPDSPIYIYNWANIKKRIQIFTQVLDTQLNSHGITHGCHYAMKANAMPEILRRIAQEFSSMGVDTVSGGEIQAALAAGFPPKQILFSGVGKSYSELELALDKCIYQINVESLEEMDRIASLAQKRNVKAPIGLRLNPNVISPTHPHIATGYREHKFGMDLESLPIIKDRLRKHKNQLELCSLTVHIGSQILELNAFETAVSSILKVYQTMHEEFPSLNRIDLGGGLGIHYDRGDEAQDWDLLATYSQIIEKVFSGSGVKRILTEPGRWLVARSGLLLTSVEYIKKTPFKKFVIVNAGMNHLLRPALYGAHHRILPFLQLDSHNESISSSKDNNNSGNVISEIYDVVGPICESSDVFARGVSLPILQEGDLIAFADCGAYGAVMASRYNLRPAAREIVIDE